MKKIFLVIIVLIIVSAGFWLLQRNNVKESEINNNVIKNVYAKCFKQIFDDGSVIKANFIFNNNFVEGQLLYLWAQKDNSKGYFKGELKNNIISGEDTFMSEGQESVGRVVFRYDDKSLIQGTGPNSDIFEGSITLIETDCWKTYINSEQGYLFQYPKEWTVAINKYNSKNVLFGPGATSENGYGGIEFYGNLLAGQSLKDFIKKFNSGVESGSVFETETIINGQTAVVSIMPKASMEPTESKSVGFEKGGKVFSMYLMYKTDFVKYPEDKQRLDIFNQMVDTFKFSD